MNDAQEQKTNGISRETLRAEKLRLSYLPKDDVNRYPFQFPARGIAVSRFVFSLAHLFSFGIFPPLACLGVVCSAIAFLKGNRQSVTYLGFAFGLIGLAVSLWMTLKFGSYTADPAAFLQLFTDASSDASSASSSMSSSAASAVSSAAEAVLSTVG